MMARANSVRVHNIRAGLSWMDPLVLFLKHDTLPEDKNEADKIRRKTSRFWLSEDSKLYKRSFSGPYLLCVHPDATDLILEELHEGICRSHTGGRSLSHRAITQDYWWPSMQKEAQEFVKKCDQCQRFALNIHQPGRTLNPLSSLWPFAQLGTKDFFLSARIISQSGLKLSRWQTLETLMPRNLFGKISSLDSESLTP